MPLLSGSCPPACSRGCPQCPRGGGQLQRPARRRTYQSHPFGCCLALTGVVDPRIPNFPSSGAAGGRRGADSSHEPAAPPPGCAAPRPRPPGGAGSAHPGGLHPPPSYLIFFYYFFFRCKRCCVKVLLAVLPFLAAGRLLKIMKSAKVLVFPVYELKDATCWNIFFFPCLFIFHSLILFFFFWCLKSSSQDPPLLYINLVLFLCQTSSRWSKILRQTAFNRA